MTRTPAPQTQLRDVELLIRAHHPILFLETVEDQRGQALLEHVADHLTLLFVSWTRTKGLEHVLVPGAIDGTDDPLGCLQHITKSKTESLYYLGNFVPFLDDQSVRDELKKAHAALWKHRGAIIITGTEALDLHPDVEKLVTTVRLAPATDKEYHAFLSAMLADIRKRQPVAVELTPVDMTRLLQHLRGLTFFEVRKVMTLAIAENWKLDKGAIDRVLHAKQEAVLKTGVLEYTPPDATLDGMP